MTNNAIIGTYRSPDDPVIWVEHFAGFYLNNVPTLFSGNVAAGSDNTGAHRGGVVVARGGHC